MCFFSLLFWVSFVFGLDIWIPQAALVFLRGFFPLRMAADIDTNSLPTFRGGWFYDARWRFVFF